MSLLNSLIEISDANRVVDQGRLEEGVVIKGDFEGSVTGHWVKLDVTGAGIVEYNKKHYTTVPIGFVSLPPGHAVELNYANGIYYSKF